ncbi:transglutaminase TgpA family protein [Pseudoxanthomonas mexicana]
MARPDVPLPDRVSRLWTLASATLCLVALLLLLPASLALVLGVAGTALALLSWWRPLPAVLRVLLAFSALGAVLYMTGMRFGRDTGCALLAAMLAIKPTETFTLRDNRSLLGFAFFAPFAAFLLDQGPWTMTLGLLGVCSGLLALQRLADVEAHVEAAPNDTIPQLALVGRLVLIGLPLVLAAFWLFPRLASPLWGVPDRAMARPGLSDDMSPGGWLDLMADDSAAFRAQFFGKTPSPSQMYWRGPVLWNFDGRVWTQATWLRGLPPAEMARAETAWDYQLEIEPTDRRQLVALDLPVAAPDNAHLANDYSLSVRTPLSALTRWRMRSAAPLRFEADLPLTLKQQALQLPPGLNPRALDLGRRWRREAGDDDDALVQRALAWIRAEFAYTLDTPLPGRHAVDEFLFDQKQGYCEHFSSSFVFLMRAAGVPARVVTGYTGGVYNRLGGYWVVRQMDAHAWAEVWLPGRGWVRVDPTAAVAPERIYDTLDDRLGEGVDAGRLTLEGFGSVSDWLRRGWNDLVLGFDAGRQAQLLERLGANGLGSAGLGVLFGIAALGTLGWMGWWLARAERDRDPLLRAWHRLGRRYARLGLGREPYETSTDWARRVAAHRPKGANLLFSLSRRFAAARYAPDEGDHRALIEDLRRHRP